MSKSVHIQDLEDEDILQHDGGWILPNGTYLPCRWHEHNDVLYELYDMKLLNNIDYQHVTETLGWVHLQAHVFYCFAINTQDLKIVLSNGQVTHGRQAPTDEQQHFIYNYIRIKSKERPHLEFKINGDIVTQDTVYDYFQNHWR